MEDPVHLVRVAVEGRREADPRLAVREIGQDRAPEIADADQGHGGLDVPGEDGVDGRDEVVDRVAPAGAAGKADGHEVPPDLRRRGHGRGGELMGVDLARARRGNLKEEAAVQAQAADRLNGEPG